MTGPIPGSYARWFAEKIGWPLERLTVLVEGNHDERYLRLADRLYFEQHHRRLIGSGLTVAPAGDGPDGGCRRLVQDFLYLFRAVSEDLGADLRPVYRLVAVVDDDDAGRGAFNRLVDDKLDCQGWRDVFKLQRIYPLTTRSSRELKTQIARANESFRGLDCEIEDLFAHSFLDAFCHENPGCCLTPPEFRENGHHYPLTRDSKTRLLRYAENNAMLEDIPGLLHLLQALRYYLGLDPDGDSP